MAYTKKTWVNVPDPDNYTGDIPLSELPRYDAENMNRIEDGVDESKKHIESSYLHNRSINGGAALGSDATSLGHGGAIGKNAKEDRGGGAVGCDAYADTGGAVGYSATVSSGGAAGNRAHATTGGAVGLQAIAGRGFSGGYNAQVSTDESGEYLDAIQLGTGTNTTPKTLQAYNYRLMKADGTIPDERLPMFGKIQSGTYKGTGNNSQGIPLKVSLSFNFTPKYVFVKKKNGETHAHFLYGENYVVVFTVSNCCGVDVIWGDKTLEWQLLDSYPSHVSYGLNVAGTEYSWVAIG